MADEEKSEKGQVSEAIDSVANLAKAAPIYDDALKPIMQETGKALSTVGRAVNVALSPIRGFVWGAEQVEVWLTERVAKKLEGTDPSHIVTPDLAVAGPTIEALKFNGHKPELSDMFAGLLAGAMDSSIKDKAHPSYVEIIKSMDSAEARIFAELSVSQAFPTMIVNKVTEGVAGVEPIVSSIHPRFMEIAREVGLPDKGLFYAVQSRIENLNRLGLVLIQNEGWLTSEVHQQAYKEMEDGEYFQAFKRQDEPGKVTYQFAKGYVRLTQFGKALGDIVFA